MKRSKGTTIALLFAAIGVAAAPLVALRVEVEAVSASGRDTTMSIRIQIAPEDRVRIGTKALIQGELRRGKRTFERLARTVEISRSGEARVEVQWPPGEYDLRIDIESTTGDATGFWRGRIEIPLLEEEASPPSPANSGDPAPAVAETTATAAAVDTATSPPKTVPDEPPAPAEAPEQKTLATQPKPEPPVVAAVAAAAASSDWGGSEADLTGITVMVTERNQPILGLAAADFRLQLDGRETAIDELGDKRQAPLWLGLAVDVSRSMGDLLPALNRHLTSFSLRSPRGTFLITGDDVPNQTLDWGATPTDLATHLGRIGTAAEGDLAAMVTMALNNFDQKNGRKFLIVVTDGGDIGSKESWRGATDAAAAAGVPTLVIGFRGDGLRERTRTNLERIAAATGGRSYFLADVGLFEMTLDYLGQLVDASYALLFSGTGSQVSKLKVTTGNKGFQVHHPKTAR